MDSALAKVTRNGQISLPAEVRHRWAADAVIVVDRGDYVIVRPMPGDPITALAGIFAGPGPTTDDMRTAERVGDVEREERRRRHP
ncbi:MAG: AbrB/MazE/SpoVT family DNA-binding domain-containing protein [Candidatus Dormiibacterota bacterium]